MAKVTAVCLSSTLQRSITFKTLFLDKVNRSEKYEIYASGKAVNAARVLNQLSRDYCEVVCPLGESNAPHFMELAERDKMKVHGVLIPGYTRECWTLLDKNEHTTTELVVGEPVVEGDFETKAKEILSNVSNCLAKTDALLFAGSRPKIWPENMCAEICKIAADAKKFIMVDFWGDDLIATLKVCTPDVIKINEEEFCKTFGYDFPQLEDKLKNLIAEQSKKMDNIFIITRGSDATIAADAGEVFVEPVQEVEVLNTIGCGDAFSAGFLHDYLETGKMKEALAKGTWCAGRNAEREAPGTVA